MRHVYSRFAPSNYKKQFYETDKYLLLLAGCILQIPNSFGQISQPVEKDPAEKTLRSELNTPRTGDFLIRERVAYLQPGEGGENLTWDFGKLDYIKDSALRYFYRSDKGLIAAENGSLQSCHLSGDSLLTTGYENPGNLVRYHQAGLLLKFPLACGDETTGNYQGRGKHGDRLESVISGSIHTQADAAGSLILPGNDTLTGVIRVHIRKTETAYYSPITSEFDIERPLDETDRTDSLQQADRTETDTYRWYAEGYRYPVFETVETYRNQSGERIPLWRASYFYHPEEQVYDLAEDTANRVVLEKKRRESKALPNKGNITDFRSYPNPVQHLLEIEYSINRSVEVQISLFDFYGKLYYRFPVTEQSGRICRTLDMSSYPQGDYLLTLSAGNEKRSETIVKK